VADRDREVAVVRIVRASRVGALEVLSMDTDAVGGEERRHAPILSR
jgi:hypothetical protein